MTSHIKHATPRRGITVTETLVAFGLLGTVLSTTAPLVVRHDRLLNEARVYRLAVDELSNRLAAITAMAPGEAEAAVAAMPQEPLGGALADAKLSGVVEADDVGSRVVVTLSWPKAYRNRSDVTLTGWRFAIAQEGSP